MQRTSLSGVKGVRGDPSGGLPVEGSPPVGPTPPGSGRGVSIGGGFWGRFLQNRRAVIGLALLLMFYLLAILAPWLASYGVNEQSLADRLKPPSGTHWMGTDRYGRDILSRALWAGQISQSVGLFSMGISIGVGIVIGALAGFYSGWIDHLLSRLTETIITFPTYFIMILIVALFGASFLNLILVIGLTSWPITARVVRAEFLSLKERPFVESALATGAGKLRVMVRHILPNVVPVIVVAATLRVAYVILAEAGLSYLGFGIQPPTPSWGNMVAEGRTFLRTAWWITVFPGLFIFLSVMAYNLIGDGLRDAFDPRMQAPGEATSKPPLGRSNV